ncbi:MAG: succinate dehydrogenase iron-sulfur subunit [Deltaproteobacteria bacterium]|nr:succinate dehydrogenase iron-sulfur subunit [Deltaproteobacteria bacterium]MDP2969456.1 succinate dehydrogenase iron-sulfur subunit [Deltaproteobacteria bacterium]
MLVKLKIFRFDPEKDEKPYYQTYEVEADPMDRLLDCLNRIRWEQDPTLSFRMSCGHGVCGSDGMRINGICGLACQKLVRSFKEVVLIEPLPVFKVVKDLVVDLGPFFEKYQSIKPYLITQTPPPDQERKQLPEEHRQFEEAIRCILCACCTASCPINQNKETEQYVGPAALVRAFRYLFDSRDEASEERTALLDHKDRAWGCQTLWKCTEVCPKEIPVTQQIGQIKKRIYEAKNK